MTAPARRWILAGVIVLVGLSQAWDSDVFTAPPPAWILTAVAILVAASAPLLNASRAAGWIAAVVIPAILLTAARMLSPHPLPALLVIVVAAGALLWGNEVLERREAEEGRAGSAR